MRLKASDIDDIKGMSTAIVDSNGLFVIEKICEFILEHEFKSFGEFLLEKYAYCEEEVESIRDALACNDTESIDKYVLNGVDADINEASLHNKRTVFDHIYALALYAQTHIVKEGEGEPRLWDVSIRNSNGDCLENCDLQFGTITEIAQSMIGQYISVNAGGNDKKRLHVSLIPKSVHRDIHHRTLDPVRVRVQDNKGHELPPKAVENLLKLDKTVVTSIRRDGDCGSIVEIVSVTSRANLRRIALEKLTDDEKRALGLEIPDGE